MYIIYLVSKAFRLPVSPVKTWMTRYCLKEISEPLSVPFLNFPRRAHSPSIISISILSTSLRNNDFSVKKKVKGPYVIWAKIFQIKIFVLRETWKGSKNIKTWATRVTVYVLLTTSPAPALPIKSNREQRSWAIVAARGLKLEPLPLLVQLSSGTSEAAGHKHPFLDSPFCPLNPETHLTPKLPYTVTSKISSLIQSSSGSLRHPAYTVLTHGLS